MPHFYELKMKERAVLNKTEKNVTDTHYNFKNVSVDGIEPSTSVLSGQRSTTELHAHNT